MKLAMNTGFFIGMILSLSLLGCAGKQPEVSATINQSASLTGKLPMNPLQWKVITSMVNKLDSTMSTLYGNDVAVNYARTNSLHNYPNGSVLALVTWTQREDERWYGAKIPNQVKSIEFVYVKVEADGRASYMYRDYEGNPLKQMSLQAGQVPGERPAYILSQRAAVMP